MIARGRLLAERKEWRKDHPHGFVAKPRTRDDGTQDLLAWDVRIPAKESSVWFPAMLSARMVFSEDYPNSPPVVIFNKINNEPLFHPNVYMDGRVCLSIINPENSTHAYGKGGTWCPSITIKQVLLALQIFLDEPTSFAAGRQEPYKLYVSNFEEYKKRVQMQVRHVSD
jgi:ubiquitin-conjugating enzyme E2 I